MSEAHTTLGYGAADPEADTVESALAKAMQIVRKRADDGLIVFLVVFGISLLYTLTATPTYEARAQVLIETAAPNVVSFPEVLEQSNATLEYYQTQYRILQSRSLIKRTLDEAHLWQHAQLTPQPPSGFSPRRAVSAVRGWVSGLFGSTAVAAGARTPDADIQARKIDAFLGGLSIVPVRSSRIVEVRYLSADPVFAATAANAVARAYIQQNLDLRYDASQEASDWLRTQMDEQRKAVEASELALQKYREDYDSISLEERQNIVVQRLADLNTALTRARTQRIGKESDYQRLQEVQQDRAALDAFPAVLANTFIQQLKGELASLQRQQAQLGERLGERHPDMVKIRSEIQSAEAKLQAETGTVAQAVRSEYLTAVREERSLQASLDEQKREAQELNRRAIDYGVLQRDATTNRQLFDALLQRTKETGISGALRTSNIRVVDDAEVPRSPSYPSKVTNLMLGLVSGVFFAFSFIFAVDLLDNRLKSPSEVKSVLRLPFLGVIPMSDTHHGDLLVNNGVGPEFAESMRSLRSNVLFSSTPDTNRSVVVTSTMPGEGKTLVASNLALSLAMAGQRVLLIDADMRRPRLHQIFNVSQEPGLSNVIIGKTRPSEVVQKTSVPNLCLLPAGYVPPNPPELLASRRFKELLEAFDNYFEWVIIDSPPAMGVTDAAVIGHITSGVLFVVGSEMTTRGAARMALEQLDAARVKYVGAVLNRVELDDFPYSYYSH